MKNSHKNTAGMEIIMHKDDSLRIMIALKNTKDKEAEHEIIRYVEASCLDELTSVLYPGIHVSLCITGKGVKHSIIMNQDSEAVIPGDKYVKDINKTSVLYQTTPCMDGRILSLCRKERIDPVIAFMKANHYCIREIILGPFRITDLVKHMADPATKNIKIDALHHRIITEFISSVG
jgi:hypothetical protein